MEQAVDPGCAEYVLLLQLTQALALPEPTAVEYRPAPHGVQLLLEMMPTPVENKPALQPTHAADTLDIQMPVPYVPLPHCVHWPDAGRPVAVE